MPHPPGGLSIPDEEPLTVERRLDRKERSIIDRAYDTFSFIRKPKNFCACGNPAYTPVNSHSPSNRCIVCIDGEKKMNSIERETWEKVRVTDYLFTLLGYAKIREVDEACWLCHNCQNLITFEMEARITQQYYSRTKHIMYCKWFKRF